MALFALVGCETPSSAPSEPAETEACGAIPTTGCPCTSTRPIECGWSPEGDAGASCMYGTRTCQDGVWGACMAELEDGVGSVSAPLIVGPVRCEACDPACRTFNDEPGPADLPDRSMNLEYDGDEGGVVLEGEFITCMSLSCATTGGSGVGTGSPWMPTPDNSDGVVVDPTDGALTLGVSTSNRNGVWVASMDDGTVSRLDPVSGREVGRYPSTRPGPTNGARPAYEACNWNNRGNCPSRTAVDQNFDVYVANRAFGNQGTVSKIAGSIEGCVDRNGDGVIQTSRDVNGNGVIDRASAVEFPGVNDECLLWTVDVGGRNAVPRALAVGTAATGVGDVWVGLFNTEQACRLRPDTGAAIGGCVSIAPVNPYGAVADPAGRIWFTSRAASTRALGHVNPSTGVWTMAANAPSNLVSYGMTVWSNSTLTQTYLYIAQSDNNRIFRYDVNTNSWFVRDLSSLGQYVTPRGVAASETDLWVATYTNGTGWGGGCSNRFMRLALPSLNSGSMYSATGSSCHLGIGVGFDNAVWSVAAGTQNAVRLAPDRASYVVTPGLFVSPYTYSDFIGFGLNVFANPRGNYQFVIDSECDNYRWAQLQWTASLPAGTSVEYYVRSSATTAGLATQPWLGPFTGVSPADLTVAPGPVPAGRFLEVDIRMATADRTVTPRIYDVQGTGMCDRNVYEPIGVYGQRYDASPDRPDPMDPTRELGCPRGTRPVWGDLNWSVETAPTAGYEDTSVTFLITTATVEADLTTSTPVALPVPPTSPPVNVDAVLAGAGLPRNNPFLGVAAVLRSNPAMTRTPVLHEFGVEFRCVPTE
ncbi:MAG: hypothetical protein H6724_13180 [Sandaracinus sp.]|nr:hypothetical protein [Sandaracinus sp.]